MAGTDAACDWIGLQATAPFAGLQKPLWLVTLYDAYRAAFFGRPEATFQVLTDADPPWNWKVYLGVYTGGTKMALSSKLGNEINRIRLHVAQHANAKSIG